VKGAIHRVPQLCTLVAVQLNGGPRQTPIDPAGDRHHHLQIARQIGDSGRRRFGFALPLGLQKQLRLFENALADGRRSVSPCGIQLPGFAAGEPMRRQRFGHALAVVGVGTCYRHQELHRHVRRNRAVAYLLLHAFRKLIDQR
jgi:hypothetical protein